MDTSDRETMRPKEHHVDIVRNALGTNVVDILTTLFDVSQGFPPSVSATSFRRDHPEWIDDLRTLADGPAHHHQLYR